MRTFREILIEKIRRYKELIFLIFLLFYSINTFIATKTIPIAIEIYYFIPLIISLIYYKGKREPLFFILFFLYLIGDIYASIFLAANKIYNNEGISFKEIGEFKVKLLIESFICASCYILSGYSFIRNNPFFLYILKTNDKIYGIIYIFTGIIFILVALFFIYFISNVLII